MAVAAIVAFWNLAQAAAENRLRFEHCFVAPTLGPHVDIERAPTTTAAEKSQSDSRVLFGRLEKAGAGTGSAVVVKSWFSAPPVTSALDYEAEAYRYVTEHAVLRGRTPAIAPFLASGECLYDDVVAHARFGDATRREFERMRAKTLLDAVRAGSIEVSPADRQRVLRGDPLAVARICAEKLPTLRMLATLSPCRSGAPCPTLLDFFKRRPAGVELLPILFSLAHTVDALARIGVQHNDLHPQNVVFSSDEPGINLDTALAFVVAPANNETIRVPQDVRALTPRNLPLAPFVFDWDRSFVAGLAMRNPSLEGRYCDGYGQCPRIDTSYDMYTLLYGALRSPELMRELGGWLTPSDVDIARDQDARHAACESDFPGRCGARARLWSKYPHRRRGLPLHPATFPSAADLIRRPIIANRFPLENARGHARFLLFAPPGVDRERVRADIDQFLMATRARAKLGELAELAIPAPISPPPTETIDPATPPASAVEALSSQ